MYKKKILKVSSKSPIWISDSATALSAIEKMNSRKITSLLVAHNQDINKKIKNYGIKSQDLLKSVEFILDRKF